MYKNIAAPYVPDSSLIIGPDSSDFNDLAVITGWTPRNRVQKHFYDNGVQPAVIGNLYSEEGVPYIFYNLLANQIGRICIIKKTNLDGVAERLYSFFCMFNVSGTIWNNSSFNLNEELYTAICDRMHQSKYDVTYFVDEKAACRYYKNNNHKKNPNLWALPSIILNVPGAVPTEVLPSNIHNHTVHGTITQCYKQLLSRIMAFGQQNNLGDSDNSVKELLNFRAIINPLPNDLTNTENELGSSSLGDGIYYNLSQDSEFLRCDQERLFKYRDQILTDEPVPGVNYTYGQRIRNFRDTDGHDHSGLKQELGINQLDQVLDKLGREPDSSSAVINLWRTSDHQRGGSPCLNHMWFKKVGDTLTLTLTFRSHDMFDGWPLNLLAFSDLLCYVAEKLKLNPGVIIVNSLSAHIYARSFAQVEKHLALFEHYSPQFFADPIGNFVFSNSASPEKFDVMHYHNSVLIGHYNCRANTTSMKSFLSKITKKFPNIMPDHLAYLATTYSEKIVACIGAQSGLWPRQLTHTSVQRMEKIALPEIAVNTAQKIPREEYDGILELEAL